MVDYICWNALGCYFWCGICVVGSWRCWQTFWTLFIQSRLGGMQKTEFVGDLQRVSIFGQFPSIGYFLMGMEKFLEG